MGAAVDGSEQKSISLKSIKINNMDDKSVHHGDEAKAGVAVEELLRSGGAGEAINNDINGTMDSSPKDSPPRSSAEILRPLPHLPQPEAPPGVGAVDEDPALPTAITRSATTNGRIDEERIRAGGAGEAVMDLSLSASTAGRTAIGSGGGGIGKYIRERGSAWVRRLSLGDDDSTGRYHGMEKDLDKEQLKYLSPPSPMVTEYHLSGVRVIVQVKDDDDDETGPEAATEPEAAQTTTTTTRPQPQPSAPAAPRITFFSRSNCRDCGAVRSFFRSRLLPYVEINLDVFPSRLKDLVRRTGSQSVPQIFFNGSHVGGLVALNSLRNSGEFDRRLKELLEVEDGLAVLPPPDVPAVGVDDDDEEESCWTEDSMAGLARAVRERVIVGDRIARMKIVRSCFSGSELVEAVIDHLDCGRKKAVEMCKELERKHFLHHAFRDQGFQDGPNHLYRFLDHDPAMYKCYNMGLGLSYREPRPASWVATRITNIMHAMLEAYASDDRKRLDYNRVAASEEFRRYVKVAQELQRVDVFTLSADERLAFFLNLYNSMVIHAAVCVGRPQGGAGAFDVGGGYYADFHYMVGGYPYSLSTVKNGILRGNRRQPYSIARPLAASDRRLELAPAKMNPLIHFGLCDSTRSSPPVRFFSPQGVDGELRNAAREFFRSGGMEVDLEKRTVYLTKIIKWYSADFGQEKEILNWVLTFLDATRAGLLTHLLSDGGPVSVVYQDYDSSLNI